MNITIDQLGESWLEQAATLCTHNLAALCQALSLAHTSPSTSQNNANNLVLEYLQNLLNQKPAPVGANNSATSVGWVAFDNSSRQLQAMLAGSFHKLQPEDSLFVYMPPSYVTLPLAVCQAVSHEAATECFPLLLEAVRTEAVRQDVDRLQVSVPVGDWQQGSLWRRLGFEPDVIMAGLSLTGWQSVSHPHPPELTVRTATESDLEALTDLALEEHLYHALHTRTGTSPHQLRATSYRTAQETLARSPQTSRQLVAYYQAPTEPDGLAQPVGSLVGSIAQLEADRVARYYMPPRYGYIGLTSVSESLRGKGVGRALVETILRWFLENGIETVFLHYVSSNVLSRAFWSRQGFAPYQEVLTCVL